MKIDKELPSIYEAIATSRKMFNGKDKEENFRERTRYVESIADAWRGSKPGLDVKAILPIPY